MKRIKLFALTIYKGLFFIITAPLTFVLMFIDVIVYIITLRKIQIKLSDGCSEFCINHLKKVVDLEIKIIFQK